MIDLDKKFNDALNYVLSCIDEMNIVGYGIQF